MAKSSSATNLATSVNSVNLEAFCATIDAVKNDPKKGATAWTVKTKWKGGFKTEAKLRGFSLSFDEPEPVGGTDTTASPHETVLACYGACLTVGLALNAALKNIKLKSVEVDLEGHIDLPGFLGMSGVEGLKDLPGYHTVIATVKVKSDAKEEEITKIFDRVVKYSPVGLTLSRPVDVRTRLEYNKA